MKRCCFRACIQSGDSYVSPMGPAPLHPRTLEVYFA